MITTHLESPRLTPTNIDEFHKRGYLAVDQVSTPDDLHEIQSRLDGLYARFNELPPGVAIDLGGDGRGGKPQIPEINSATQLEPSLMESLAFVNCREIARQLFGHAVHFSGDHAIYKAPRSTKPTPWHQDQAYLGHSLAGRTVTFWIPLQDVTIEMGCMQFVPYSHHDGLKPHHRVGGATGHSLTLGDVDPSAAVACPLPAGGATMHTPLTVHAAGPNQTDRVRRAWILAFSAHSRYGLVRAATVAVKVASRVRATVGRHPT
jgi:hypothetical protein